MNKKELNQQKKQAQLDKRNADVDKLKAKASEANADAQLKLNKQIKALDGKMAKGKSKIAHASENAWQSTKDNADSAWGSVKSAFSDVSTKFKK